MFNEIYHKKKVLITGHTGFKGTWLALWLQRLGAEVIGFSLEKFDNDHLFNSVKLGEKITDIRGDINNLSQLQQVFEQYQPEFVFHLAAQPIVRASYDRPVETFRTNIQGTVNVLECIRNSPSVKSALIITTDKVYESKEHWHGYREIDPLRGSGDPYSCSKACAELIVESYRKSFFVHQEKLVATARAGNVLGGGDFGQDRIIPDCVRSLREGEPIKIRNPHSIRPWQYILDVLNHYLTLGQKLMERNEPTADAWNVGPLVSSVVTVKELADETVSVWGQGSLAIEGNHSLADPLQPKKESSFLNLDVSKAYFELGCRPKYGFKETIYHTINWYKRFNEENAYDLCLKDIERFESFKLEK
ncbi:MAG: CDP-glucose 4,6-dehydratase [Nanoarchaeota archaeon]